MFRPAMAAKQALPMNGGVGDQSYACNSSIQKRTFLKAKPILEENIKRVYYSILPNCLKVADLGCSSGPNTLQVASEIINIVDATSCDLNLKLPVFQFFLNDLFGNDFNTVFNSLLPQFYETTLKEENKGHKFGLECFINATPGSFYKRLFPSNSIHFFHSSYSLQWLSQAHFDISPPITSTMRSKVLSSIAVKWRQFKSKLTSTYIYGSKQGQTPCDRYPLIDEETWAQFVEQRLSDTWKDVRKKAKDIQAKNVTPHILSRGGYRRLEEAIMREKEARIEETPDAEPPSPPSRHEKWKKARIRRSGAYTTDDSRVVAEKIDSLVDDYTQGTFRPQGRQDILSTAIGRPEHPGRVRAAGKGVGIRAYFGAADSTSSSSGVNSQESIDELTARITQDVRQSLAEEVRQQVTAEVTERLMREFETRLSSYGFSQQPQTQPQPQHDGMTLAGRVSTKGSCAPPSHLEPSPAQQKIKTYISTDHPIESLTDLARSLLDEPMEVPWDSTTFFRASDVPLYLYSSDLLEVAAGNEYLNISVIQMWCMYLKSVMTGRRSEFYGFLDPQLTQMVGNKAQDSQNYITRTILNSGKRIFFAPYIASSHWQLLVLSITDNTATWFCSLHKKPHQDFRSIVDSAFAHYNMLNGRPPSSAPRLDWTILKSNKQRGGYECGYYVMQWMTTIVHSGITQAFEQHFRDTTPFSSDSLYYIRDTWAKYVIETYNNLD